MSRARTGVAVALLALASLAIPAGSSADTSNPTWAGVWDTDFGRMTLSAGGSGSYEGYSPGTVSGPASGRVNQGTWRQPGDPPKSGPYKFTMDGSGLSFTGDWSYEGDGCGSACGWNGHCIDGPCLKNNDPAPTPSCTPRARGASAFAAGLCPISFGETTSIPAPAPGKAANISPAAIPPETFELIAEILQEEQDRKATELAAAIAAKLEEPGARETYVGCMLFASDLELGRTDLGDPVSNSENENVVAATLSAACGEFLLRQKFGTHARSAARVAADGCTAVFVPAFRKGTKVTKKRVARARAAAGRQLRLSCKQTARGMRFAVKARHAGTPLRRIVGKRVGSRLARVARRGKKAPAGQRIGVRWRALKR